MKKSLSSFFHKSSNVCNLIANKLNQQYQSPQQIRIVPWSEIQGDKTLRLDYDLEENSIVFDVGGYEGQWASDIFAKYCCTIHIFEPVPQFAENIKKRFIKNSKIIVHQFGFANETIGTKISISQDSSSIFKKAMNSVDIRLVRAIDFINEHNINKIDLMKINIEGCEYDLLDHLLETDFITNIQNIQVQFHDFIPNAMERMKKIQDKLSITHELTYQFQFVWENWKLKI